MDEVDFIFSIEPKNRVEKNFFIRPIRAISLHFPLSR